MRSCYPKEVDEAFKKWAKIDKDVRQREKAAETDKSLSLLEQLRKSAHTAQEKKELDSIRETLQDYIDKEYYNVPAEIREKYPRFSGNFLLFELKDMIEHLPCKKTK